MRRGFKAWCERTSVEYRRSLGIRLASPLDPRRLAELLGVAVTTPGQMPGLSPAALSQLTRVDTDSWSAVTVSHDDRWLVVLNSGQSRVRRANSLAHELAHIILNHSPDDPILSSEGVLFRRSYDPSLEEEADWLAGCLVGAAPRPRGRRPSDARSRAPRGSVQGQQADDRLEAARYRRGEAAEGNGCRARVREASRGCRLATHVPTGPARNARRVFSRSRGRSRSPGRCGRARNGT